MDVAKRSKVNSWGFSSSSSRPFLLLFRSPFRVSSEILGKNSNSSLTLAHSSLLLALLFHPKELLRLLLRFARSRFTFYLISFVIISNFLPRSSCPARSHLPSRRGHLKEASTTKQTFNDDSWIGMTSEMEFFRCSGHIIGYESSARKKIIYLIIEWVCDRAKIAIKFATSPLCVRCLLDN